MALVQAQTSAGSQESTEDAEEATLLGAPDPAKYKTHSTSIVEVLEDLKEKAEEELAALRKAEVNAQHNFDMLKQSLEDQAAFDKKNMAEEQAAAAEGDLANTVKDLAAAEDGLATAQTDCMQVAAD